MFHENPAEFNSSLTLGGLAAQVSLFRRIIGMQMNLMLVHDVTGFEERLTSRSRNTAAWIDVWVPFDVPPSAVADPLRTLRGSDLSLLLQYGHLLARAHQDAGRTNLALRMVQVAPAEASDADVAEMEAQLLRLANEARIPDARARVARSKKR